MKYLFFLSFLLLGCASRAVEIAPEAKIYADRWEGIYGIEVDVPVKMADLKDNTVGLCTTKGGKGVEITLDIEFWNEASDYGREELIFHEFGHCLMGLGHDSTKVVINGKTIPRSIMFPYVIGDTTYSENQNYYREELKTSKASEKEEVQECKHGI